MSNAAYLAHNAAYMVREDWARDIALEENSRPIHEWIGGRPHLVVVHEHPSRHRERTADAEAIGHISPTATRLGIMSMGELRSHARNQPVEQPILFVHPAEGRDADEEIRRLAATERLADIFVLLWAPEWRLRLWLDAIGAIDLATGNRADAPDPVLLEACRTIQAEEYNGLGGSRGKDTTIGAIRALTAEGYPLDDAAWGRAILAAGASLESADVVMQFVREVRQGRRHRVQPRLNSNIVNVWRERAARRDTP